MNQSHKTTVLMVVAILMGYIVGSVLPMRVVPDPDSLPHAERGIY